MSGPFANEDVMEEYLSALLTEEALGADDQVHKQTVARLLEPVAKEKVPAPDTVLEEVIAPEVVVPAKPEVAVEPETQAAGAPPEEVIGSRVIEGRFQALFFNVAGLTLAVPLTELGGIHNLEKPGPLFGKPDWFMGVMLHREEKLNVVDTARWVMPEKCNEILEDSLKYKYLIMLDDSGWGLACEELVNTVNLVSEDVKWRDVGGKRPWLAGMVKEKMCAMLDVKQLIAMLNKGLNSNG
ncbi:MAG: chemotaxis protein CheW [Aestuariibacter sp.]